MAGIPEETHVILQKLAQMEYREMRLTKNNLAVKIPLEWSSRMGNEGGLAFYDVHNSDVIGSIFALNENADAQGIMAELEKRFVTQWNLVKTQSMEPPSSVIETVFVFQGRIAGVETRLLVGAGHTTPEKQILVVCAAPELWYRSYEPVFWDILKSVLIIG